jgi:hypothetical protein
MRKLLAEPMLHFVLIGITLFVAYKWLAPNSASRSRVVVTQVAVDDLITQHVSAKGRVPSPAELRHLVDSWVRDEILYREGVELGLDRDDIVVKRRVRQKVEVMAEEGASTTAPTDADLSAYLSAHQDQFIRPAVLTFEQVFLGHSKMSPELRLVVARARDAVRRGDDPGQLGEPSLLPSRATEMPADLVARDFGEPFATALEQAPLGTWTGPIESSFGSHFVRVTARTPAATPPLDDVRAEVQREWENDRRRHARDDGYAKMRSKYDVIVETTSASGGE